MNKEEIFNYCVENLKCSEIKKDEPMKKHTSFKIGGNADIFIKISDLDDLKNILKFQKHLKKKADVMFTQLPLVCLRLF